MGEREPGANSVETLQVRDLVQVREFPVGGQSEQGVNPRILRPALNDFNNYLYVLIAGAQGALQRLDHEDPSYAQLNEITKVAEQLALCVKRLQNLIEGTADFYGTETILIVDDEAGVRELLKGALHDLGYVIREAAGGEEALRECGTYPGTIHLALVDVGMRPMTGYELVRRLSDVKPSMKVIYMSGGTFDHRLAGPGAQFLKKPFELLEVPQKVWRVLNGP